MKERARMRERERKGEGGRLRYEVIQKKVLESDEHKKRICPKTER